MTKRRGKKHLEKAIKATLDVKSDKPVLSPALVGAYVDGAQTIAVSGRPDYIWVRIRGATSEVAVAFNDKVAQVWDLPILVYRDPDFQDRWRVYGRDIRAYEDWGGVSYVQPHGPSHSFSNSETSGQDVAWIYKRQYNPLQPRPVVTGTAGIYLEPDFYYAQGAYHWWPGSGTGDLISGNLPTGAHNGRYVTVYLDSEDKIPGYLLGPEFNIYFPPSDPGDYIALPDPSTGVPIGAVRLYTGTTEIGWNEIYDLRSPQQPLNPSGSVIDVYDENVLLGTARGFNFVGEGVQAVISGTVAHIMHTGSGGGGHETGTMVLYDESDWIGVFDEMRFIGPGVSVFNSGSYAAIAITGTAGGGGGHETGTLVVYEEDTFLGVFEEMRFIGDGITAYNSGSYVAVVSTGTASAGAGEGTGTYVRSGEAYPLVAITGGYWNVTEGEYMTGTLAVALNGVWQTPVTDFTELYPSSGTFVFVGPVETGTVVSAIWGAPDTSGGGGSGGHETGTMVTYDEDTFVGVFEEYRFIGPGVSVFNSGSYGAIAITGTAGGGGGHETGTMVIYDEGDWLGVFDEMRFIGPGVSAFNSGTYAAIAITGTAGGGGGHETGTMVTYDEDDFVGVFKEYRFKGDGVDVYNSGSYGAISIPGGGGGDDPLVITTGTFWVEEVLYDETLASNTGSFIWPEIPQGYDHLKVRVYSRSTIAAVAEFFNIYYNNDQTASNYRYANHHAGSSHSTSVGDNARAGIAAGATAGAGQYGISITEIMDYTVTGIFQVARSIGGERNSSTTIYNRDQLFAWEKYEAINRIDVTLDSGDFVAGSHAQLIGVKETVLVTAVEGTVSQVGITTGSSVVAEWDWEIATGAFSLVVPDWAYDLYDDLELLVVARTDRSGQTLEGLRMQFAEEGGSIDTGANYWRRSEENYAGGTTTESNLAATNIFLGRFAFAGATAVAGRFGHGQYKVMGALKGTDAPTIQGSTIVYDINTNWRRDLVFGGWRTQARLGQIDIWTANASNYVSGSYARLIGIPAKDVSGGGSGTVTGSFAVFDDGASKGQVGALNFEQSLDVVVTGSVAHINVATPDEWHWVGSGSSVSFENGWVNYSSSWHGAAYIKDASGVVHVEGMIKDGSLANPAFTLPEGYRPLEDLMIIELRDANAIGRMHVTSAGVIQPHTGATGWFSIHVSFYVGW